MKYLELDYSMLLYELSFFSLQLFFLVIYFFMLLLDFWSLNDMSVWDGQLSGSIEIIISLDIKLGGDGNGECMS